MQELADMGGGPSAIGPKVRPDLLEHVVPNRECGDCVACCDILEIRSPDLQKPAHVLCPHCVSGGCGIYENRPNVCRDWFCLWRRIEALPDEMRPDKCGVVLSIGQHNPPRTVFEHAYIVARAIDDPSVFQTRTVKDALEMFAEEGSLPVWVGFEGAKRLYFPANAFADAIMRPDTTPWDSLVIPALAWRKRYGLD
jgi:hypothetical protein